MPSSHLPARLALAALAGAALPAMAARTFTNQTESLVCLVPDPDHLPAAGMTVTLGRGCAARENEDWAEAVTVRAETRDSEPHTAPIALVRLAPDWSRTVLYLEPGASVSLAAGPGRTEPLTARFRVGTPWRADLGAIRIHPEHLEVAFETKLDAKGRMVEHMGGRLLQPDQAKPWPGHVYSFRSGGDDGPDLELVDRPAPAACILL